MLTVLRPGLDNAGWNCGITGDPEGAGERRPVVIGVINNMPDAVIESVERQFAKVLSAASGDLSVQLMFFSLPSMPRASQVQFYVQRHYFNSRYLQGAGIDGLIVTGAAPKARDLRAEPYWPDLTELVDWVDRSGIPTIWSCLAAHAAVLYLDGVERVLLPDKLSGVFDCAIVDEHAIVQGLGPRITVPHSRFNHLRKSDLCIKGYRILSQSTETGVDMFVRKGCSPFLFMQGHPEYDAGALAGEFQRDVLRFLRGKSDWYPVTPKEYFSEKVCAKLAAFREQVVRQRDPVLEAKFQKIVHGKYKHSWHAVAVRLYANWLRVVAASKTFVPGGVPLTGNTEPPMVVSAA